MTSLREIRNEKNKDKYRQKSLSLDVSPDLLNLHINKYAINCTKIVKEANNKKELDNIFRDELIRSEGKDFYDYSILMGFHYGVYNLYCYNHLTEVLIRKVLKIDPNVEKTKNFFIMYKTEIITYLKNKYTIEENIIINIINKMFTIIEDNPLYNEEIIKDINKILLGTELTFTEEKIKSESQDVKKAILLGEVINNYDKINNQEKEVPSILPKI